MQQHLIRGVEAIYELYLCERHFPQFRKTDRRYDVGIVRLIILFSKKPLYLRSGILNEKFAKNTEMSKRCTVCVFNSLKRIPSNFVYPCT